MDLPQSNRQSITNYELRDDMGYSIYSVIGKRFTIHVSQKNCIFVLQSNLLK